jgi:hypothetical protein
LSSGRSGGESGVSSFCAGFEVVGAPVAVSGLSLDVEGVDPREFDGSLVPAKA